MLESFSPPLNFTKGKSKEIMLFEFDVHFCIRLVFEFFNFVVCIILRWSFRPDVVHGSHVTKLYIISTLCASGDNFLYIYNLMNMKHYIRIGCKYVMFKLKEQLSGIVDFFLFFCVCLQNNFKFWFIYAYVRLIVCLLKLDILQVIMTCFIVKL